MIDKKILENAIRKGALGSILIFMAIFSFSEFIAAQSGEKNEINGFIFGFTILISIMFFLRSVLMELFVKEDDKKVQRATVTLTDQDNNNA